MMKNYGRRSILIILFFLFGIPLSSSVHAQTLKIEPETINKGESVTVTVSDLLNDPLVTLYFQRNGDCKTSTTDLLHIQGVGNSCVVPAGPPAPPAYWSNLSCPNGTPPGPFAGTINSDKLYLPNETVTDKTMRLCMQTSDDEGNIYYAEDFFTIRATTTDNTTVTIDSILNEDGSTNSESSPANPGSTIKINLSGTKNGTYKYYLELGNQSTPESANCTGTTCTLSLKIPDATQANKVQLIIQDPDNKQKSAYVYIHSEVTNTIPTTPTPTETPPPPFPPCYQPSRSSNGEQVGCAGVWSGLGMNLPTDPSRFVAQIFGILLSLSGGIAVLLIIRSGYQMMTSAGNPEAVKEARERITSAIIGLLFLIFSLVILEVIGVDILHIPGFGR